MKRIVFLILVLLSLNTYARKNNWQEGYEQGYIKGISDSGEFFRGQYDEGYKAGRKSIIDEYNDLLDKLEEAAKEEGFEEGKKVATKEAYEQGYMEGGDWGYSVGTMEAEHTYNKKIEELKKTYTTDLRVARSNGYNDGLAAGRASAMATMKTKPVNHYRYEKDSNFGIGILFFLLFIVLIVYFGIKLSIPKNINTITVQEHENIVNQHIGSWEKDLERLREAQSMYVWLKNEHNKLVYKHNDLVGKYKRLRDDKDNKKDAPSDGEIMSERVAKAILGVTGTFTKDTLRRAFRVAASNLHPDKYSGNDPYIKDEINKRFKKLNTAYDFLKKYC